MRTAYNPQTREVLGLKNGQWTKLQTASNDKGDMLYLGDSGWEPLNLGSASTPDQPQQGEKSFWENARDAIGMHDPGRAFSLGSRNVLEGLGKGATLGLGDPGRVISDWMGLAKPETDAERMRGAFIEGAAGTLPMLGTGAVMQGAKAAPKIAQYLTASPALQVAGDASANLASEVARQSGAGEGGQFAAALAGGVAPGAALAPFRVAGRAIGTGITALDALSSAGQKKIAGSTLRRMATTPEGIERAIRERLPASELVPGSAPTLGQIAEDPGIAALERSLKDTDTQGGRITNRYGEQEQARQAALADVYNRANPRVAGLRAGIDSELSRTAMSTDASQVGKDLLEARNAGETAFKKQFVTPAYESVDPEGTSRFLVQPILDDAKTYANKMFGRYRVHSPDSATQRQINAMREAMDAEGAVPFSEINHWRSALSEAAFNDAKAGDYRQAAMANRIKGFLDGYVDDMSYNEALRGQRPQINSRSPLYKEATRYAEQAVGNDPFWDDMAEIAKRGINKDEFVRLFGRRSFDDVQAAYPNLIRKSGTLDPSQLGADMVSARAGGFETDYAPRDATGFVNMIVDRFGPQTQTRKQQIATLRDQYLAENLPAHTGLSPEQAEKFREAKSANREMNRAFREGPNKGLNATYSGPESAVPKRYFHAGEGSKEDIQTFMRGVGRDPQAVENLKRYALSQAAESAVGKGKGRATSQGLKNWMYAHRNAIDEVPGLRKDLNAMLRTINITEAAEQGLDSAISLSKTGDLRANALINSDLFDWRKGGTFRDRLISSGAFDDQDLSSLSNVRADLARAQRADRLASTSGSATAKNLATQHILDRALGGDVGRTGGPTGKTLTDNLIARAASIPGNIIGEKLQKWVYGGADSAVRDYLTQAMLDPNYALELLGRAKPKEIPAIVKVLKDIRRGMAMTAGRTSLLDLISQMQE